MAHRTHHLTTPRTLLTGLVAIVAFSAASVALAPSAWAGHSEVEVSVACTTSGDVVIDWTWVAYRHQTVDPSPGFVAVEYGATADLAPSDRDWVLIAEEPLTEQDHTVAAQTVLAPPAGATLVRLQIYAYWSGTTYPIDWLQFTTAWLALPTDCRTTATTQQTTTTTVDTTTTTVGNTTTTVGGGVDSTSSTTVAGGVGSTSSTTVAGGVLSSGAQASGAAAQVVPAQAAPAQTLPNTGSSTGVLLASGVLLVSLGGGLVLASTRRMAG